MFNQGIPERDQMKSIAVAAVLTIAALGLSSPAANAAGCVKGAIVGGVAGHYAGNHGLLGAGAGCLVDRHYARSTRASG